MKYSLLLLALAIFGCQSNPYREFYKDMTRGVDPKTIPGIEIPASTPEVEHVHDHDEMAKGMLENGFVLLGTSSFSASDISDSEAIAQAKKVKAAKVMISKVYQSTQSGQMAMSMPTSQTTYGMHSGNVGGYNYYGNSQYTTYGTQTTYVPYSVDRYSYLASFWIKRPYQVFGAIFREKTDQERISSGTNKGVAVSVVIRNSPAYAADVMPDDLISSINEIEIADVAQVLKVIQDLAGKTVTVKVSRAGKPLKISVALNQAPSPPEDRATASEP